MASRAHLRVLIVEDYPIVAIGVTRMLEELGHTVVDIATSFEEALEATAEHEPDLIVMDVDLGADKDGIDAAVAIRSHFGTPSLILTGYSSSELADRAATARPLAILDKTAPKARIEAVLQAAEWPQAPRAKTSM